MQNAVIVLCILVGSVSAYLKSTAVTEPDVTSLASTREYNDQLVRNRRQVSNPAVAGFTKQEATDIVYQHNLLRTNTTPAAADMEKMIWNEYLAEMAQDWANTCAWQHGQPTRSWTPWSAIGQNLYLHSARYDGKAATDSWWGEWVDYTYNAPAGTYLGLSANCTPGAQCGHYTQVVWHDSYAIGCGVKYCSPFTSGYSGNGYYIVCNYGPAGNFRQSTLYTSGSACTSCPGSRPSCTTSPVAGLCDWSTACGGLTCANGGTMDTDPCICACTSGWDGQFCNVSTTAPTTAATTQNNAGTTLSSMLLLSALVLLALSVLR